MPIRQVTPQAQLERQLQAMVQQAKAEIVERMLWIGEETTNEARRYNGKQYTDQTGNLRSSTGYALVVDGETTNVSDFPQVPPRNDPRGEAGQGSPTGRSYAEQVATQFPTGIALVVVAGMSYAKYVSNRGYNVLDSARTYARSQVEQLVKKLRK